MNHPSSPGEAAYDAALVANTWGGNRAIEQAFRSRPIGDARFAMGDGSVHFSRAGKHLSDPLLVAAHLTAAGRRQPDR